MKKGITEKKKSKKYKLWYRILAYLGVILILFIACSLPISAVIDVSRGEGDDYVISANSPFPLDIGFTYRSSPNSTYNYTLMTSLGGFGQEWNRTSYGEDVVFYMCDEFGDPVEVERSISYSYGDVVWTTEQAYINQINGNRLGFQPITIGASTPDVAADQPVTTIVLRGSDIVYNTAWLEWYTITQDNLEPPTLESLGNCGIPMIAAPNVIDPTTERFIGTLNISYDIIGNSSLIEHVNYAVPVDTQVSNDPIPLLSISNLQSYDIVENPRLLIRNYSAWWDVDYYTKSVGTPAQIPGGTYQGITGATFSDIERYNIPFTANGTSYDGIESIAGVIYYYTTDNTNTIVSRDQAYAGGVWNEGFDQIQLDYNFTVFSQFKAFFDAAYSFVEPVEDPLVGTWVFNDDLIIRSKFDFVYSIGSIDTPIGMITYTIADGTQVTYDITCDLYDVDIPAENGFYGIYTALVNSQYRFSFVHNGQEAQLPLNFYRTVVLEISDAIYNDNIVIATDFLPWLQSSATKQSGSGGSATYEDYNTTSDQINNNIFGTWSKDANASNKNYVQLMMPLYDTSEAYASDSAQIAAQDIYFSFPNALSYARSLDLISFDDISWTDWLVNGAGGFLNFEIVPGLSLAGILGILIMFSVVMMFLKLFAGG